MSNRGWYNRGMLGEDAAQIAIDEAAAEAARQAARDADALAREVDEHHFATNLKAYRKAQMARASAELAASPPPAALPAQQADVVPDPAKVAEAVARLRAPRPRSPGGDTGNFTGGIRL
jgi:hypothetical protein